MAVVNNFTNITGFKPEDDLMFTFMFGKTGVTMTRDSMSDLSSNLLTANTDNSNVIKCALRTSLMKGKVKTSWSWENDGDITQSDLEKFVELNENDPIKTSTNYSESSIADALANKNFNFTYEYDGNCTTMQDLQIQWQLQAKATIESLADDTVFLCTVTSNPDYSGKIIDIPTGQTKEVTKHGTTTYVLFSETCKIGSTDIPQYSIKKLTSSAVNVTNNSSNTARLLIVGK